MKKNLIFIFCVFFLAACLEPCLFVAHAGKTGSSFIQPGNTPGLPTAQQQFPEIFNQATQMDTGGDNPSIQNSYQRNQNNNQNNINSILSLDEDTNPVLSIDPNDNDFKMDDGDLSHSSSNENRSSSIRILGIRNPLADNTRNSLIGNKRKPPSSQSSTVTGENLSSKSQKTHETKETKLLSLSGEKEISDLAGGMGEGELPDVLVSLIGDYVDISKNNHDEFLGLRDFFKMEGELTFTTKQYKARKAQEEIKELIGEFKWIEPGSMIAGATPEEPDPWDNNLPQRYVEIKEGFGMPVTDVTVKNYKYLYDEKMDESTLKKPMRGLTRKQWIEYAAKLTTRLKELFPIAYPRLTFREAKVPGEAEKDYIEYATTIPIEPRREEFPKESGKYFTITAEHSVYSGLNLIVRTDTPEHQAEDEAKLKQFADSKTYDDGVDEDEDAGPADVDLVDPNPRGLKGLSGGVSKIIDVPYDPANGSPGSPCLVFSGFWFCGSDDVRVCSRLDLGAEEASSYVGVRLVLLFSDYASFPLKYE